MLSLAALAAVFWLGSTAAVAQTYSDTIRAQSEAHRAAQQEAAAVQGQMYANWQRLPPRTKQLYTAVDNYVAAYQQRTGRIASLSDKAFVQAVYKHAGVRNSDEKQLVYSRIRTAIEWQQQIRQTDRTICSMYSEWWGVRKQGC